MEKETVDAFSRLADALGSLGVPYKEAEQTFNECYQAGLEGGEQAAVNAVNTAISVAIARDSLSSLAEE